MKKTIYSLLILATIISCNNQNATKTVETAHKEYPFVPDGLELISEDELMDRGLPSNLDLVFYENGNKTTFQKVMPLIIQRKLIPKMFIDKNGNYKALVVTEIKPPKIEYKNIPEHLAHLGYSFGNPDSKIVIVNTQGGPMPKLLSKEFESFFVGMGGIDVDEVFAINVHQAHTLHPEQFDKKQITHEQSKKYSKETTKILHDIVNYFKTQNKTVYITGFSYGAFAGIDFIAEYGNIADGYLLMAGRLDMTEKVWKSFSNGIEATFKEDGTEVVVHSKIDNIVQNNLKVIAAGMGYNRYTNLLKDTNLSNLIYVYGEKDQAVGKLTNKEIEFLKLKSATVLAKDKGHEVWQDFLKEGLELLLNK